MTADGQVLVNLGLVHREGSVIRYWDDWLTWMPTQGWRFFGWYVWDQSVTVPGDWAGRLAPRHEFVFHFNREARKPNKIVPCKFAGQDVHLRPDGSSSGGLRAREGERTAWNHVGRVTQDFRIPDSVITVTRQRGAIGEGIDHPAVFPVGLPAFVMDAYTDPGEAVFEPFGGSGTSLLAAQQTGRRGFALEIAPAYVDVADQALPAELSRRAGDAGGQRSELRGGGRGAPGFPGGRGVSPSWLAERIEQWPIERVIPYANNARTHSEAQVAQIAASMVEFGVTNPLLAGSDGVLVAGHGRLLAARKLGLTAVPVVVLDHLTPTQRRALVIADNRIAENAGWDEALLHLELEALQADDFDLSLTGFDPDDLADLLAGEEPEHQGQTEDDAAPEVPESPVSTTGDLWVLGPHRVLCGDATDPDAYAVLLRDELAAMVFSDPPYDVNYANSAKDKLRGKHRPILNDNLGEDFEPFLQAALTPMLAHCAGAIYIAMSSSELDTLQAAFRAAGGHWSTFVIWAKNTFTLGRSDYQRQYEPILYGWPEGAQRHWCGDRDQGDVWQIKKPARNDLHPTMKPVELVERAIRNSSRPGDRVLDPFGGSGTTLIAAEKSGRVARLMELDPRYVDVIVRRWQEWTGKTATRESDGVAFDELVAGSNGGLDAVIE